MNVIIDAHFPRNLVWLFQEFGFYAYHTLGLPNQNFTTDNQILTFAEVHDCVVMTKDADFVNSFYLQGRPKKLLLVSTGNIRNGDLKNLLSANLTEIFTLLADNHFLELTQEHLIIHE